ncbi:hypothetical protein AMTR_s00089p00174120, partial [Amborella trichopoda]
MARLIGLVRNPLAQTKSGCGPRALSLSPASLLLCYPGLTLCVDLGSFLQPGPLSSIPFPPRDTCSSSLEALAALRCDLSLPAVVRATAHPLVSCVAALYLPCLVAFPPFPAVR